MKKAASSVLFVFLLAFFAQAQVKINTPINFTVTDTHGNSHTLFDYLNDGKYVLIDFFFTTCGACNTTMPNLKEAYKRYGCNQEDVVFIALNRGNTDAQVVRHENTYNGFFPTASGLDGLADDVITAYGVTAFPTVALIAPNHTFISTDIYPVTPTNLDKAIHFNAGIGYTTPCDALDAHHLLSHNLELSLYPNPVTNTASIQIDIIHAMNVKVNIINLLGQTIDTPIDTTLSQPITKIVDFGRFKPGVYFIQLLTNGQIISTQRFSKIAP